MKSAFLNRFPVDTRNFMRDQYAGDVSDLLKFAFLRTLAAHDRTVGVGWYYNPESDGRFQDGRHREYCDELKWKAFDLSLFNALRELPERSVKALEELPIWPPKTRFHRLPVPPARHRRSWAIDMKNTLQEASIVFLDPDNGVGAASERHATVEEIAAMRRPGRVVALIKFPKRENHGLQVKKHHSLLEAQTGTTRLVTVRTCVSVVVVNKGGRPQTVPRNRWFTIIDADDCLIERAKQFARDLNDIEKCKADVVCGIEYRDMTIPNTTIAESPQSAPAQLPPTHGTEKVKNVCPECGQQFRGSGFDGIDAHWRAKHEAVMPYQEAWPLVKSGNYHR
jgi:hypothetical protein